MIAFIIKFSIHSYFNTIDKNSKLTKVRQNSLIQEQMTYQLAQKIIMAFKFFTKQTKHFKFS